MRYNAVIDKYNLTGISPRGAIRSNNENLKRLGEAQDFLFDLDDTIAVYSDQFIKKSLYASIKDHSYHVSDTDAEMHSTLLHASMHHGDKQKEILESVISPDSIRSFWEGFTDYLHRDIKHEDVHFDPKFVKLANFAIRNGLEIGVISNSTPNAGHKVLSILDDTTGIDLHDRATFLGSSTDRKPKSAALKIYETETGHKVNTERAVYIGNSVSDLLFSKNTGMTPVLVDYGNTAEDISESPQGKALIDDSIIINDFATLKNEIELLRPNYKRQISFTVDKSLTSGERSIDRASITLDPTEETVYRVTHDACNEVMSHVPEIWKRFQDRFSGSQDRFSLTSLPSYRHLISEASGAIILPHIDSIGDKQIQEYYTRNRIRQEGPHTLNRGPLYYRQYIDELKGDSLKQLAIIKDEINVALEAISNPSAQTNADHIALLGIEDNLRGNMLAAYLSAINVLRESPDHSNIQEVLVLAKNLQSAYSDAVQIQYSHMLGIKHDRQATIETLKTKVGFIDDYSRLCTEASINPKVKNPEIDNPLLIAARATTYVSNTQIQLS